MRLSSIAVSLVADTATPPLLQDKIRDVYEQAVANVPLVLEKKYWRRYVYFWVNYALFEELDARDTEKARGVYRMALKTIPHKSFTFSKLWILAANFEVRQHDLGAARKLLGVAIGLCPKERVLKHYINMEITLGNIDRARKLYEKYLEVMPYNCNAWAKVRRVCALSMCVALSDFPPPPFLPSLRSWRQTSARWSVLAPSLSLL